jgi:DNA helicase II / ATP-dependent DNA helicase PcrA
MTELLSRARLDQAMGITATEEQWAAITAPLTPGVIVAGAGSGKTTSMAARVAWLVGSGLVLPDRVLGLTFTTKAATQLLGAMRSAVASLGIEPMEESERGDPQVLTYNAFGAAIVNEHAMRLGREPNPTLLTPGARQQLAFHVVCRTAVDLSSLDKSPVQVTSYLLELDDQLSELSITPAELVAYEDRTIEYLTSVGALQKIGHSMLATARARRALAEVIVEWRAVKADRDLIDYSDQIRLAGELVAGFSDVQEQIAARFDVVLLDEYQDTSIGQRKLLQGIFGSRAAVTAVGDPCQAIYGWRGASVANIDDFLVHFTGSRSASAAYSLSQNRRSGPAILELANAVSSDLRAQHDTVRELVTGPQDRGPGLVDIGLFDTIDDELSWLCQRIREVHSRCSSDESVAVLGTTGTDLARVDRLLRDLGVPTQLAGAAALLAQPAVIDARSMLEVLHDPTANPAFLRVAAGPRWRIGPRDLAALGHRAKVIARSAGRSTATDVETALADAVVGGDPVEIASLSDALFDLGSPDDYSADAMSRFGALAREIAALRAATDLPLIDLIGRVIRTTGVGVEAQVADAQVADDGDDTHQRSLSAFLEFAAEFTELDGRVTLGAFLSRLKDAERFDADIEFASPRIPGAVQLLTVHKAKGLEFTHVFIPHVASGAFPSGVSSGNWTTSLGHVPWPLREDCPPDLASFPDWVESPRAKDHEAYRDLLKARAEFDTDRLGYVAITRAERSLTVTSHWWGGTQVKPRGPHRIFTLLADQIRELAAVSDHCRIVCWAPAPEDGATNPLVREVAEQYLPWPAPISPTYERDIHRAAKAVRSATSIPEPLFEADERLARWSLLTAALTEESERRFATEHVVRLGAAVGASTFLRAMAEPDALARDLARPMPRKPSAAAERGTAWHAWVEASFGQQSLLDPEDLPGAADDHIATAAELEALKQAFAKSEFAAMVPVAVERAFSLVIGGRVISGRIDAVFERDGKFDVIDWKTGSAISTDPLQLALYRLAWSAIAGVDWRDVDAGFVMVATGDVIRPSTDSDIEALLALDVPS